MLKNKSILNIPPDDIILFKKRYINFKQRWEDWQNHAKFACERINKLDYYDNRITFFLFKTNSC